MSIVTHDELTMSKQNRENAVNITVTAEQRHSMQRRSKTCFHTLSGDRASQAIALPSQGSGRSRKGVKTYSQVQYDVLLWANSSRSSIGRDRYSVAAMSIDAKVTFTEEHDVDVNLAYLSSVQDWLVPMLPGIADPGSDIL